MNVILKHKNFINNIQFKVYRFQTNEFSLFITDIQEFYELTLLDDTKTIQQKTVETLQIASKWEQENSLKISDVSVVKTSSKSLHSK